MGKGEGPMSSTVPAEISRFADLWHGGYHEGDPLDPLGLSSYDDLGYISVLHAVYQCCVRPYAVPGSTVLEIGPGRGAWTRTMLSARFCSVTSPEARRGLGSH